MSAATSAPVGVPDNGQRRSLELHPEVERQIAARRERLRRGPVVDRDRAVTYALAVAFVACCVVFGVLTSGDARPAAWVVSMYVVLYALLSRVQFEVGSLGAVPVQLLLVPMLFALPPAWVPLCVAAGYVLRDPVAIVRGKLTPWRVSLRLVSAWHALGPAVLFAVFRPIGGPRWSEWPLYAAALLAQFFVDTVVASIRERGLGLKGRPLKGTCLVFGVDAALAPIGLLVAFTTTTRPYLVVLVLPLVGLIEVFAHEREQRIDAALELGHAYRGTAMLLGDVVEADDAYTGEHSRDVVSLTIAVAERLGLDARERRNAEFVALLHDVGKIRIPTEIVNKPGPLDPDERAVIETHTVEGEAMLTKVGGLLGDIGRIVRSCHERWDGAGYPDGLRGQEIPLIARIVCCTDAFSAMTTTRPYRAAMTAADALAELRRCAGTHFDPQVVEAVCAIAEVAPAAGRAAFAPIHAPRTPAATISGAAAAS